jgi:hypothetical protein
MPERRKPPSQTWRALLENHLSELVSIDFLIVPTATIRVLFEWDFGKPEAQQACRCSAVTSWGGQDDKDAVQG